MESVKKFLSLAVMAILGAMVVNAPARADSSDHVVVNVPFDFVVGNSTMKAGDYKIKKLDSGVLELMSSDGQQDHFALVTEGAASANHKGNPYLLFTRYGSQAFLSKVALSVDDSYDLLRSNEEKKLINSLPAGESGALVTQPVR
jgi:hypothetical protein